MLKITTNYLFTLLIIVVFFGVIESYASDYELLKNRLQKQIIIHVSELQSSGWIDNGGLEILTAGPSSSMGQSRFGHVALRFVNSRAEALDDIVFEALAINDIKDSGLQLIIKGVGGEYPVTILPSDLSKVIVNYYAVESRGYSRTILPSNPNLRRNLLKTILAMGNEKISDGDKYYFFTNNCADYLAQVLEKSGFQQIDTPKPFIPTMFSQHLKRSFLTPWPDLASLSRKHITKLTNLGLKNDNFNKWRTLDLQQYIVFSDKISINEASYEELRQRKDFSSTEEVYGFVEAPGWMYQRSENFDRAINMNIFDKETIRFQNLQLNAIINSTYRSAFCTKNSDQCDYFIKQKNNLQKFLF